MPGSYTPSAPYGTGTDDYRCFLLDPELDRAAWLTGTQVLPGNPDVVHHVILFQVPPAQVAAAEAKDAAEEDEGWTCFGGTGLDPFQDVNKSSWIGAWAPGGKESVIKPGFGIKLAKGSRIVMQVHYNLLAGTQPDTSAAQLRLAPAQAPLPGAQHHAPARAGRAAVPREARRRRRCATATRRWPTSRSASAPRATPPTSSTSCAVASPSRARRRPACARCPSRSRSTASPATCTCSAAPSRSRSGRARRRRRPSSTSRSGTSTTRAAGRSSRSRCSRSSR